MLSSNGSPLTLSECNQRFTPPKRKIKHGTDNRSPFPPLVSEKRDLSGQKKKSFPSLVTPHSKTASFLCSSDLWHRLGWPSTALEQKILVQGSMMLTRPGTHDAKPRHRAESGTFFLLPNSSPPRAPPYMCSCSPKILLDCKTEFWSFHKGQQIDTDRTSCHCVELGIGFRIGSESFTCSIDVRLINDDTPHSHDTGNDNNGKCRTKPYGYALQKSARRKIGLVPLREL